MQKLNKSIENFIDFLEKTIKNYSLPDQYLVIMNQVLENEKNNQLFWKEKEKFDLIKTNINQVCFIILILGGIITHFYHNIQMQLFTIGIEGITIIVAIINIRRKFKSTNKLQLINTDSLTIQLNNLKTKNL